MAKKKEYEEAGNFLKRCLVIDDSEMSWALAFGIEEAVCEDDKEYLCLLIDELIEYATKIKRSL